MATDNISHPKIIATDPLEENLSWLQEFHATKIKSLIKSTLYIEDESINPYLGYNNYIPIENLPNIGFRISAVDNPGWSVEFNDETEQISRVLNLIPINIEEKTDRIIEYSYPEEVEMDSLFTNFRYNSYYSFSSALYLNLAIKVFILCINGNDLPNIKSISSIRKIYKENNLLLTWLEEFYFSCCDGDWEHNGGGGMGLIATHEGWIFSYPVMELIYNNKNFNDLFLRQEEGSIRCYKHEGVFITRTHPRGLITGLKIFKEWIES